MVAGVVIAVAGSVYAMGSKPHMADQGMDKKAAMMASVYVCPDCHTMALKAGKCPMCKKDMQASHLLGTKDGQAMVCACGGGCACDAKGVKEGKCACGKAVGMVSCKGMYVCPKGCAEISDKPGKCACGMEMMKVE